MSVFKRNAIQIKLFEVSCKTLKLHFKLKLFDDLIHKDLVISAFFIDKKINTIKKI